VGGVVPAALGSCRPSERWSNISGLPRVWSALGPDLFGEALLASATLLPVGTEVRYRLWGSALLLL